GQWILHRSRLESSFLQASNHFRPTGAICVGTVNQDYVAGGDVSLRLDFLPGKTKERDRADSNSRSRESASIDHVYISTY
ncbi:hypothetical protein, partial [Nostoc sp.]